MIWFFYLLQMLNMLRLICKKVITLQSLDLNPLSIPFVILRNGFVFRQIHTGPTLCGRYTIKLTKSDLSAKYTRRTSSVVISHLKMV